MARRYRFAALAVAAIYLVSLSSCCGFVGVTRKVIVVTQVPATLEDEEEVEPEPVSPEPQTQSPLPKPTLESEQTAVATAISAQAELSDEDQATATPVPTSEPVATFTPPSELATSSVVDHYWLRRPIGPDGVNWTARSYPYGSTWGGKLSTHHGVEFVNPVGEPVLAAADGTVIIAGTDHELLVGPKTDYYGKLVVLQHDQFGGQPIFTVYGHLSQVSATVSQTVATGDEIGLVGGTGVANGGAHLHFEVRLGENHFDSTRNPDLWIVPYYGRGTIAGRLTWSDGSYVEEGPLLIRRADDPTLFVNRSIFTYADKSVNPDDNMGENFAAPDIPEGPYEVILKEGSQPQTILVWVYAGKTTIVDITLHP